MLLRAEEPGDAIAIANVTEAAFASHPHSAGTEAAIVERLRAANALVVSLVAVERNVIVGHVAFSPVAIGGRDVRWHALGPLSVSPECQRAGIGSALVREGLDRLRAIGSAGCLLVGDPAYYARFGFRRTPGLSCPEPLAPYLQALRLNDDAPPQGEVAFHAAFGN